MGRRDAFAGFARHDFGARSLERRTKTGRARQRIPIKRFAKIGEAAPIVAAERLPVRGGGGEDDRVVVPQRFDERSRITRGHDDHAPANASFPQHVGEVLRFEIAPVAQLAADDNGSILAAMRRQREEQHVLVEVHALAQRVQRVPQRGCGGQRIFQ